MSRRWMLMAALCLFLSVAGLMAYKFTRPHYYFGKEAFGSGQCIETVSYTQEWYRRYLRDHHGRRPQRDYNCPRYR